jgi:NAD(P)-dependent dehydrogenase (short-subunit alcohol dehydrogenase family)
VWQDTIDTSLTGVWNTMAAAIPHLITAGGGSIIATSSTAGLKDMPFLAPYVAAKHAVAGICRSLASELAGHHIRVNTVHPAGVDTPMVTGLETLEPFLSQSPGLGAIFTNGLPVEALDPRNKPPA